MMVTYKATTVDDYIEHQVPAAQPSLTILRELILTTVPEVEESISWNVPFYKFHGQLGGITAYQKHVSFAVAGAHLDDALRTELEAQGYKTLARGLQISFDQVVPVGLIQKLLIERAQANIETGK